MRKRIRNYFFGTLIFIIIGVFQSFTTKLPKVFVIGDSISIHYGPYLKRSLKGFFLYDRKRDKGESLKDLDNPIGANGGDSGMVLGYLKELEKDQNFNTDYLLINCGLHDIKRKSSTAPCQLSLQAYRNNLQQIVEIAQKVPAKMIWINSTPVIDSIHNARVSFFRFSKDIIHYNQVADSIMKSKHIPVIDLYTFTSKFIPEGYQDHIHYKADIRKEQADFITGNLIAILNCEKNEE